MVLSKAAEKVREDEKCKAQMKKQTDVLGLRGGELGKVVQHPVFLHNHNQMNSWTWKERSASVGGADSKATVA